MKFFAYAFFTLLISGIVGFTPARAASSVPCTREYRPHVQLSIHPVSAVAGLGGQLQVEVAVTRRVSTIIVGRLGLVTAGFFEHQSGDLGTPYLGLGLETGSRIYLNNRGMAGLFVQPSVALDRVVKLGLLVSSQEAIWLSLRTKVGYQWAPFKHMRLSLSASPVLTIPLDKRAGPRQGGGKQTHSSSLVFLSPELDFGVGVAF